jgi:hypothetical protein
VRDEISLKQKIFFLNIQKTKWSKDLM